MEMRVLGISCVTNLAAGLRDQKLSHKEVLAVCAGNRQTGRAAARCHSPHRAGKRTRKSMTL